MSPTRERLECLKHYFQGSPAWEAVDWMARVLQLQSEGAEGEAFASLGVIVLALSQARERGIPPEQLEELAERGYLEAMKWVDDSALHGGEIDPLQGLTPEQRREKLLRSLDDLRGVLSPQDIELLSQARVTSL